MLPAAERSVRFESVKSKRNVQNVLLRYKIRGTRNRKAVVRSHNKYAEQMRWDGTERDGYHKIAELYG